MAKRSGLITLQSFLHKYFVKMGVDEDEFHRYHVIAADGLRDLAIHHLPISNTKVLVIDSENLTADFPDDFIDYIYIAVERDGRWWTFTRDDKMVDKTIANITGADLGIVTTVVGPGAVGGENDYWFKPDYENHRFLFSGTSSSDTVVLNYQSTGVESVSYYSTTDIEFPVYAEDAMEKYLRWQVAEWDERHPSECERRRDQYIDAIRMLRNVHNSTIDEIRDIWAGSSNVTGLIRS
jgi:hypothetical protein